MKYALAAVVLAFSLCTSVEAGGCRNGVCSLGGGPVRSAASRLRDSKPVRGLFGRICRR